MPDESCTVVLAAVHEELKAAIERLGLSPQDGDEAPGRLYGGEVAGATVVTLIAGVGRQRVARAFDWLIERHDPGRVIHAGFAGGLDPVLRPGDVPPLTVVIDEAGGAWGVGDGPPTPIGAETGDAPSRLLTLDRIADSPRAKAELFERHRAAAVDMETAGVVARAAERGVVLTVLRAISDPADMALPAEAVDWVKPDGAPDMGAAMRYVMMHPRMMGPLMQLQKHAKQAGEVLAERIDGLVRR